MLKWTTSLVANDLGHLYRLLAAVETHSTILRTSQLLLRNGQLGLNLHLARPLPTLEGIEEPWTEGTPVLATACKLLPLSDNTLLMGVLNITPDSFSDGGSYVTVDTAHNRALLMIQQGAKIVDIGAESTRPGADPVSLETELERLLPVLTRLRADPRFAHISISIDTYKPEVAQAALISGADIINDVSCGLAASACKQAPYILMHSRGNSRTMTSLTEYPEGVVPGVVKELRNRLASLRLYDFNVVLDPGLGFAKTPDQNWELLRSLRYLQTELPYPWLVGHSNKRFVREVGLPMANYAVAGAAAQAGISFLRVHDVDGHAKYLQALEKLRERL